MNRRAKFSSFALLCACLLPSPSFAQKLSVEEQQIAKRVDEALVNRTIALIEQTVNIASPTQDLAGVRQVGKVFQAEFDGLGFKTRWIDMPAEMKRAGHLVAELDGSQGKRVLLLGHLDTVLRGEKFRREGNRIYGTGTNDMKAGDAVIIAALRVLNDAGLLKDRKVIVMLTGDEESSAKPHSVSRGDMLTAAKRSDFALSFEMAIGNTATIGRRGSSTWSLEVTGETGHSSGIFGSRSGSGAILEAARILNAFHESLRGEEGLTFNPSIIVGGSEDVKITASSGTASGKANVIPNKALVRGDLRFLSEDQRESARAKMKEIVAKSHPKTSAKITFEDGIPAMQPTEGNKALLKRLDQVSKDLGLGGVPAYDPSGRGAGDIAFVSHLLPSLDGLGAMGDNSHAPGEWAELNSLPILIKRTALLIYRLTR
jgi:glutamate carboxypeptidase